MGWPSRSDDPEETFDILRRGFRVHAASFAAWPPITLLLPVTNLDDDPVVLSFQAKVNNTSLVGVGYTQTLRPGKPSHV